MFGVWIVYSICIIYMIILPYIVPVCKTQSNDPERPDFCMITSMIMIGVGAKIDELCQKIKSVGNQWETLNIQQLICLSYCLSLILLKSFYEI